MNNKQTFFFINFLLSLGLFMFLSFEKYDILSDIVKYFESIRKPLMMFSVNSIDIIIIAFIPLWTLPLSFMFKKITFGNTILISVLAFLGLVLTVVISYYLGDLFAPKLSPLIPDYVINVPFHNYQTFSIILGAFFTFIIFFLFIKNKKSKIPN